MLADLWAVADAHGAETFVLAGESMGALIAMLAAVQHPERVEGLVLVAAPRMTSAATGAALVAGSRSDYPATVAAFVRACLPEPDTAHLARFGANVMLTAN